MVARIKRTSSLSRTLNYNEQKVKQENAECIHAVNYPKDLDSMNFYDKLHRLEHQAELNERIKANSVHISLNFDAADKLNQHQLREISDSYMQQIGFGNQPYLVYEHKDAGHQHVHIVTTNIRADGSKIEMQNIGRNQSEKARKNIEQVYHLVKAEGQRKRQQQDLTQQGTQKVQYGQHPTKQAISNVLDHVVKNYNYTTLGELNAVLKLYNVMADPGEKDSRLQRHNGLLYRALDDNGNKIGTPIKASAFYSKPTLASLEKRYAENEGQRELLKKQLKVKIDWVLRGGNMSLPELRRELGRDGVEMVVRRNEQGRTYGVTFVDLKKRVSVNGSNLGKEYSAKGLEKRCGLKEEEETQTVTHEQKVRQAPQAQTPVHSYRQVQTPPPPPTPDQSHSHRESIWEILTRPEAPPEPVPYELLHELKKKKKKRLHH
jgi:relaxase-like protein